MGTTHQNTPITRAQSESTVGAQRRVASRRLGRQHSPRPAGHPPGWWPTAFGADRGRRPSAADAARATGATPPASYRSPMVAQQQLDDSSTAARWQLDGNSTAARWQLDSSSTVTPRRLDGSSTAARPQLHGSSTAAPRQLHRSQMAARPQLNGSPMAAQRQLDGSSTAARWQLNGSSTAAPPQLNGSSMSARRQQAERSSASQPGTALALHGEALLAALPHTVRHAKPPPQLRFSVCHAQRERLAVRRAARSGAGRSRGRLRSAWRCGDATARHCAQSRSGRRSAAPERG